MKIGNLVEFTPPKLFDSAKREYAKTGIIVNSKVDKMSSKMIYTVRWSDGKITTEHECYLGKVY